MSAISAFVTASVLCFTYLTIGHASEPGQSFICTRGKDSVEFSDRLRFAMSSSRKYSVTLKVVYMSDTMMLCESFYSLVHLYAKSNRLNYAAGIEVVLKAIVADTPLPINDIHDYSKYMIDGGSASLLLREVDTTITLIDALKSVSTSCNLKFATDVHSKRMGVLYRLTRERFNLIRFEDSVRVEGCYLR